MSMVLQGRRGKGARIAVALGTALIVLAACTSKSTGSGSATGTSQPTTTTTAPTTTTATGDATGTTLGLPAPAVVAAPSALDAGSIWTLSIARTVNSKGQGSNFACVQQNFAAGHLWIEGGKDTFHDLGSYKKASTPTDTVTEVFTSGTDAGYAFNGVFKGSLGEYAGTMAPSGSSGAGASAVTYSSVHLFPGKPDSAHCDSGD